MLLLRDSISGFDHRHRTDPPRRCAFDLNGKTGHLEAVGNGNAIQARKFLHVAVSLLDAGEMLLFDLKQDIETEKIYVVLVGKLIYESK